MISPSGEALPLRVDRAGNSDVLSARGDTSISTPTQDAELITRIHARDSTYLDTLFYRYSGLVLGTAFRVLGNPSDAEEVLQEVFFYLYRRSELFDPSRGTVKTWINQITLSRALDRKLSLARRRLYRGADIGSLELQADTDLEKEMDRKLSRRHLEGAFAELTAMQRQTIELFFFEGLGLREIGQQLRQPLGGVRHHLYRGLERLRKSPLLHRLRCK
jgi:RNA polymerase sigma-70 factor, ECF subfamily